jgi:uncharacterized membrane protein YobD (UPF0266 family)
MVFVVRIHIVVRVVTASKRRSRNETLILACVVLRMALLSAYWPSSKLIKKQNNQFLAAVIQEGDAKENLKSCLVVKENGICFVLFSNLRVFVLTRIKYKGKGKYLWPCMVVE